MSTNIDLPVEENKYNQSLRGFYGEFGAGERAQIFFVQSGIKPSELHRVTLISDIPGSEAWSVRDLFQREVDVRRVTFGLLPYFRDRSKTKFFNPLTLTILPIITAASEIVRDIPAIEPTDFEENGRTWTAFELPGFYRFRYIKGQEPFALVEWNDSVVKIVAIDGQHRLSALKRHLLDVSQSGQDTEFLNWTIPVVLFSMRSPEGQGTGTILDVVRSVFMYINSEARVPNEARQILLSDESISRLCTQELLEYAHENDVKKAEERDKSRIPLLFFDWRGVEEQGQRVTTPASLKSIEEIHDWMSYYVLGDDFSPEQAAALGIQPIDPLQEAFVAKKLDPNAAREARNVFRDSVLPGLAHFLENFGPYRNYIQRVRQLEDDYNAKSDVARHAFYQLRFGSNRASESLQKDISEIYNDIVDEIMDAKQELPQLIQLDIGMRGVLSAFGDLRHYYAQSIGSTSNWLEYAKWFTDAANKFYEDHWLDGTDNKKKNLLLHITHDQNETVLNYRLEQAYDALGAFVCLFIGAYGYKEDDLPNWDTWMEIWEDKSEALANTLLKGYKKEVRVILRDQYPQGGEPLKQAVNKQAQERVVKHINKLEKELDKITS